MVGDEGSENDYSNFYTVRRVQVDEDADGGASENKNENEKGGKIVNGEVGESEEVDDGEDDDEG